MGFAARPKRITPGVEMHELVAALRTELLAELGALERAH